eukprot:15028435-Alexandrium_andersonii.AAC.1
MLAADNQTPTRNRSRDGPIRGLEMTSAKLPGNGWHCCRLLQHACSALVVELSGVGSFGSQGLTRRRHPVAQPQQMP